MVANAREFLLAIKESTHTVFDDDAAEFLEDLVTAISGTVDAEMPNLTRRQRDGILFFEGALRGTQIQITGKQTQRTRARLFAMGLLDSDGNPKVPEA